jgi:hypothetical protein
LKIKKNKKRYMITAGNDRTIRDVGQSVAFGDKTLEDLKIMSIWDPVNVAARKTEI